ncbi:Zn-finger nucleic acid-binding protein [Microbacteriaceae bacterium SG_E_30_P1]|uniref:Zn-finger nucleic acid-binding protein n=1 Tax=Antiquaquibacter oligotrophicus TaxID=2880260 RepID=A0ABT6KPT5_9MICO|nr:zf-TFIIB domain-containing protein [Antiquaquibacter oligotrophicus]MDH6181194.1 Zn-finger nucleic acid-binding protein [Antiquaquibacter oligotrophicus]UDF13111.1 zf-TFIIB domain-containing protein [Antiquaquibacter oligotrophicus]
MKCPNDNTTLTMSERSGVEIDYCPECRGVWLDRGELDKIIDRAGASAPATRAPYPQTAPGYPNSGYPQQQQPYRKKKDNWLSELFD